MNQPPSGRKAHQHGDDHRAAAEDVDPKPVGAQPREGEVAGAEHPGQEQHRHRLEERDGEQEHHHGAMHREDLVVGLGPHEGRSGAWQAARGSAWRGCRRSRRTRWRRSGTAADVIVVAGREPAAQARVGRPDRRQRPVQAQCRARGGGWRSSVMARRPARNGCPVGRIMGVDGEDMLTVAVSAELGTLAGIGRRVGRPRSAGRSHGRASHRACPQDAAPRRNG